MEWRLGSVMKDEKERGFQIGMMMADENRDPESGTPETFQDPQTRQHTE